MTSSLNAFITNTKLYPDETRCDNPRRVRLHTGSLWDKISHFFELRQLDKAEKDLVLRTFSKRYNFEHNKAAFERIWNNTGAKLWTPAQTLTAGTLRAIDQKLQSELVYHGSGIEKPMETAAPKTDHSVHQLVKILLHGGHLSHKLVEKKTFRAVFVEHNPKLMHDFLTELQTELDHLAKNPPKKSSDPHSPVEHYDHELVWKAFMGNVMALLPFCYPNHGQEITIPLLKDGKVQTTKYKIDVLELPLTEGATPMTALGFIPTEDKDAPPLLSFLGTTFPAGSGFISTLIADFTPGKSVGEEVYNRNKDRIAAWMEGKTGVQAYGMSLGGAMAFHTLLYHHENLKSVDVFNPPGLYEDAWKNGIGDQCQVSIFNQPGDLVSELGFWPTGKNVSLYTVYSHQKGVGEGVLASHARAFSGCEKISIVKKDPTATNKGFGRRLLTKLHLIFGPLVFLPLCASFLLYKAAQAVHRLGLKVFNKH